MSGTGELKYVPGNGSLVQIKIFKLDTIQLMNTSSAMFKFSCNVSLQV